MDLGGYPVVLADTAGLRESTDEIEDEGIRRARARAAQADLKILLFDACDWPALPPEVATLADRDRVPVLNKLDLPPGLAAAGGAPPTPSRPGAGRGRRA